MKTTARIPFEKIRFDLPFRTHLAITLEAPHVEWEKTGRPCASSRSSTSPVR